MMKEILFLERLKLYKLVNILCSVCTQPWKRPDAETQQLTSGNIFLGKIKVPS